MTAPSEVTLRLFRFEPGVDEAPRYEVHSVPYSEHMRVLDVLNYVYEEMGGKLAYRWYCGTKKCGECAITVNGKHGPSGDSAPFRNVSCLPSHGVHTQTCCSRVPCCCVYSDSAARERLPHHPETNS